jgi:superfamily I DNA/RNA helicase
VNTEEERCLAYVAITRARERVYVSSSRSRREKWGAFSTHEPSRFIAEFSSQPGPEA